MIVRVGLLFVFLAITARITRGAMWAAFLVTAGVAGPLLGIGVTESLQILVHSAGSVPTLRLLLFVESIILLSSLLSRVGTMARLGDAVRTTLGTARGGVAILPALVGILPMPGGALFSAPLVDAVATGSTISATRRAVANYWFRHAGEFWWPLYPGVVTAIELSGISWSVWTAHLCLLSPIALLLGWLLILGPVAAHDAVSHRDRLGILKLLREMLPILIVPGTVVASHLVSLWVPRWHPDSMWLLLAGVWISIATVHARWRLGPDVIIRSVNVRMASMGIMVITLMAYKGIITESGMAVALGEEFSRAHLSPVPVAAAIACLGGLVTGIAVGFVGATFPIITSLLSHARLEYASAMGIAFVSGWLGMMLSPLHLCFIVTREHFRTPWGGMYRLLVPLTALTAALGIVGLALVGRGPGGLAPHLQSQDTSVFLAVSVRTGDADRVVRLEAPSGRVREVASPFRQQRWPALGPHGERLACLEGDRLWHLVLRRSMGDGAQSIADSLAGYRMWGAWSPDGTRFAASCVTVTAGRWMLLWEQGWHEAVRIPGAMGARCPFWTGDTLGYFVPSQDGWEMVRVVPGDSLARRLAVRLPNLEPREVSSSQHGSVVAYLATLRGEQPPRNRLWLVDSLDREAREVELGEVDIGGFSWDAKGALWFLARSGKEQRLVRLSVDGSPEAIATLDTPVFGARILPESGLIAGTARPKPGSRFGLNILGRDGSLLHTLRRRSADFWGIAVAQTSPLSPATCP